MAKKKKKAVDEEPKTKEIRLLVKTWLEVDGSLFPDPLLESWVGPQPLAAGETLTVNHKVVVDEGVTRLLHMLLPGLKLKMIGALK